MTKIAAIQYSAAMEPERALAKARQYLEAASAKGAKIACFPELFADSWFPSDKNAEAFELAEEVGGPLTKELCSLAQRFSIAVVCPFFEKGADGKHYNSALVISSAGEVLGAYRKMHVPDLPNWEEAYYFAPGDCGFKVFEVEGVKVGVQLGWDNFFPEGFRSLALGGAEVVFLPTSAAYASQERWLAMALSHAIANGLYVVRVNRIGEDSGLNFYGESFVVRPDGELVAEPLDMNEGLLLADVDPELVAEAREMWPFFADRRPDCYHAVVEPDEPSEEEGEEQP